MLINRFLHIENTKCTPRETNQNKELGKTSNCRCCVNNLGQRSKVWTPTPSLDPHMAAYMVDAALAHPLCKS